VLRSWVDFKHVLHERALFTTISLIFAPPPLGEGNHAESSQKIDLADMLLFENDPPKFLPDSGVGDWLNLGEG